MAKMKTRFDLLSAGGYPTNSRVAILHHEKGHKPSVAFFGGNRNPIRYLKKKELERFAVNILKAINSNKLKK